MSQNDYIQNIINKHSIPKQIDNFTNIYVVNPLVTVIKNWSGCYLNKIELSGSRAKGTAIDLSSDLDLFISLSSETPLSLDRIYESLFIRLTNERIKCRKQNVSIGVFYNNRKIDLVPARKQNPSSNYHSLYCRKSNSWTQTNVDLHINNVIKSNRINEIIAMKIWRENHKLDFPSIYLETYVIETLKGKTYGDIANNVWFLLKDIRDNIDTKRIIDPSNTNNILSDELTINEKHKIQNCAIDSLNKKYWSEIIW